LTVVLHERRPSLGAVKPGRPASTPGKLTISLIVLGLLTVTFGITAAVGASQRASRVASVRSDSGPLALDAQSLYRFLSDADATAGGEFLYSSQPSPDPTALAALRSRYLGDIASATANLTAVSTSRSDIDALRQLAAGIPVYTGLVETARADSRLGLPLGAAYLREASNQMRQVLLPAAKDLYIAETAQLTADRGDASGFPWIAIPLGIITLIALIRAQRAMTRRTHRVFSPGLLIATLFVVASLGWVLAAWATSASHLHRAATNGSERVQILAEARIDLLQARADEELTLIARGSDPSLDTDFAALMVDLQGPHGLLVRAKDSPSIDTSVPGSVLAAQDDLTKWRQEDAAMRAVNARGQYPAAVTAAVGTGNTDAPALFASVDRDIGAAIDTYNAQFQTQSADAASALGGLAIGVSVLIAISLSGLIVGFRRRIAEYR
jgi:hypothetical protein